MCGCPCKSSLGRVSRKVLWHPNYLELGLQVFTGHLACSMDAGIPTLPLMIVQVFLPEKPSLQHLALHISSLHGMFPLKVNVTEPLSFAVPH